MSDVSGLAQGIWKAIKDSAEADIPELKSFAKDQVEGIAQQAELIAKGIEQGWIDTSEEQQHWANTLKRMITNFIRTLRALIVVVFEKMYNAVAAVIRDAIKAATGALIPL